MRFVDNNNDQAGKDATTFMLAKGYNHLVFAYTDMDELVQTERYQGYCEALQEYDKKGSALQLSRLSDEENAVKLQTFLAENPQTEAFVACDDIMAIRLQRLFKDNNRENHYAMIGFNNSLITEIASPALTSVDIFPYELGENAAKLLLADPKNLTKQTVVIPHKIIERESTPDLD